MLHKTSYTFSTIIKPFEQDFSPAKWDSYRPALTKGMHFIFDGFEN